MAPVTGNTGKEGRREEFLISEKAQELKLVTYGMGNPRVIPEAHPLYGL